MLYKLGQDFSDILYMQLCLAVIGQFLTLSGVFRKKVGLGGGGGVESNLEGGTTTKLPPPLSML